MGRMAALLRGINVGGHRKVPMADLRALCGEIGFGDPATYVASGNLVFAAPGGAAAAADALERALARRFGFPVDVVVRTAAAWEGILRANPFPGASERDPGRVLLLLTKSPPRKAGLPELAARAAAGERIEAAGGGVWIHYPEGVGRSKLTPALLDRCLGSPATGRNWRTVLALGEMLRRRPAGSLALRRDPPAPRSPPSRR